MELEWLTKNNDIELVRVECEDTNGVSRGFTLDVDYFLSKLNEGVPITQSIYAFKINAGEVIPGTGLMGEIGFANCAMYPDISTFKVLPWEPNVASVLSDVRIDYGNPESPLHPVSPRNICKLQIEKLKSIGIQLYGSFEFEFFLLSRETGLPANNDENVFSTRSQSMDIPFVKDAMKSMKKMQILPELHHRECGQGQHEITFSPAFGILCPDNAFRFKNLLKDIASKHDLNATFMSKPFMDQPGSSGHYNHSLWDMNGKCIMYDENRRYGFSETAESWLAGLRYHSNALTSLATTTYNCFERTKTNKEDGLFAPVNDSWGFDNRSVTYRVKNKGSDNLYIENRIPGAAVNPYLFVAGCIIAGMDGIKRKLKLDVEPCMTDIAEMSHLPDQIKTLPTTMLSALKHLQEDKVFADELGSEFMKCYSAMRSNECEVMNKMLSRNDMYNWHRNNYGEFL